MIAFLIRESLERIQSKLQKKSGKEQVELKPSTSDAHEEYANSDDERKQAAKDKLYLFIFIFSFLRHNNSFYVLSSAGILSRPKLRASKGT